MIADRIDRVIHLAGVRDLEAWRVQARDLLRAGIPPGRVEWFDPDDPQGCLHAELHRRGAEPPSPQPAESLVPREFLSVARLALCHRSAAAWPLLYRLLWRLTRGGEAGLLGNSVDDDVLAARAMAKSVKRDAHKMKAFVRFRRVIDEHGAEHFVAFHRPEHPIIHLVAPFFARRFAVMRWTILSPHGAASWDGRGLSFGPPAGREDAPREDTLEEFWKTYYTSIFNPARINPRAMAREMPRKYWSTLPEAAIIDDLLANAPARTGEMMARTVGTTGAAAYLPVLPPGGARAALPVLAAAAPGCRGCNLCERATQVVFGHGPADAPMVLVGEQPGDQEDLAGRPFVGPAGKLLTAALKEAGIDRDRCYLTNAVKHFKWTPDPRGKRRLHQRPSVTEVRACKPWLEQELGLIRPRVLVLLGSTASQSLLGAGFRVTQRRGEVMRDTHFAPAVIATIHPSAILRALDEPARERSYADLVGDLRVAAGLLAA